MKKLNKILCLTLAMLMVMSTSAFAATYNTTWANVITENFSSADIASQTFYDFYNDGVPMYESNAVSLWEKFGTDANLKNLNISTEVGLGGKSMTDKALTLSATENLTSDANYIDISTVFYKESTSTKVTNNRDFVWEFDFLTEGTDNLIELVMHHSSSTYNSFKLESCASKGITIEPGKWYNVAIAFVYTNNTKPTWTVYVNGVKTSWSKTEGGERNIWKLRTRLKLLPIDEETNPFDGNKIAIDNMKVYRGAYDPTGVASALTVNTGVTDFSIDATTKTVTVPSGTTVADVNSNFTETTGGTYRVYDKDAKLYMPSVSAKDNASELAAGDVIVTENEIGNCYEYYTVAVTPSEDDEDEVADGFTATQNGANVSDLSNKTDEITFSYTASDVNDSRILLVGVYNADDNLVGVVKNEGDAVQFPAEGSETITATVPASLLSQAATVKAFVWKNLTGIQPVVETPIVLSASTVD